MATSKSSQDIFKSRSTVMLDYFDKCKIHSDTDIVNASSSTPHNLKRRRIASGIATTSSENALLDGDTSDKESFTSGVSEMDVTAINDTVTATSLTFDDLDKTVINKDDEGNAIVKKNRWPEETKNHI
jgi:hypothetical protein